MARWQDIQDYARKNYKLYEDNEGWFSLIWDVGEGRSQRIVVGAFKGYDKDWLDFRSWVCPRDAMKPEVALKKNNTFIVGHLALDEDGDYVLRHSVPLDTIDLEEFDLPLLALAMSADRMEETFSAEDRF